MSKYKINLGMGRFQQLTPENAFLNKKPLSWYGFVSTGIGKSYDALKASCGKHYSKGDPDKYFGQLTTPINILGMIQVDSNDIVQAIPLLDRVSGSPELAIQYMNYYLCMWQFPTPNTEKKYGREIKISKPYCLILKILTELYKIDHKQAYLTWYDFYNFFLDIDIGQDIPDISLIDGHYVKSNIIKARGMKKDNPDTYIQRAISNSDIVVTKDDGYYNDSGFYVGLDHVNIKRALDLSRFVLSRYSFKMFTKFDQSGPAGRKTEITEYSKFINDEKRFDSWRRYYMTIKNIADFKKICEDKGYFYDDDLIRRFVLSLDVKPFVLLTGISGSGKSKIAELWIKYLKDKNLGDGVMIAVGSNWTDNKKLLGFNNVLLESDQYQKTEMVDWIKKSNADEDHEYVIILDEMNLSRVEMYFADFLSALESLEHEIRLPDGSSVYWKSNLKIVGTVNVDESTYMFSPKVLDRANVIEMNGQRPSVYLKGSNKFAGVRRETWFTDYIDVLDKVYDALGGQFAYRVIDEVTNYIQESMKMYPRTDYKKYLDEQIFQKILPKLHGTRAQLKDKLDALNNIFEKDSNFSLSKIKTDEMIEELKSGYASFIGD